MTTKTEDIKLPPLPVAVPWHKGYDSKSLEEYGQACYNAAVEADRQHRMPSDDIKDAVSKAMLRAYSLGQTYWQQADSDYVSQNKKSDDTQRKFDDLVDDTRALLSRYGSSQPAASACGCCGGSGESTRLVGGGPDAHDELCLCPACGGTGDGQPAASAEPYDAENRCRAYYDDEKSRPFVTEGMPYRQWQAVWMAAQYDYFARSGAAPVAAPVAQEPTESVLINNVAYTVPAPVAAELLRLQIELKQGAPVAQEPVETEVVAGNNVLLPVDQMAGAPWNILDARGLRVMIAGSLDGGKWTYYPDLAAQVAQLLNESVVAPVAAQPKVTDEMVTRFLGWHLPQDFAPGAGISFTPSPDPLCWPVGTDLFRDPQARAMLEYVLTGVKK